MNLKNDLVKFITEEEINEMVISLAKEVERDYEGQELYVICPLKGSILFVSDLVGGFAELKIFILPWLNCLVAIKKMSVYYFVISGSTPLYLNN